jgi:HTH-type transcriptional regulator, transcriptional repressor of NAD biosynthesis genes
MSAPPAASQCDTLLILSYTFPEIERCSVEKRATWLRLRCPEHETLVIDNAWLQKECARQGIPYQPLPLNSEPNLTHQRYLTWLLKDVLHRKPDAFFNNEAYGEPCALVLSELLGHKVVSVQPDRMRDCVPTSASAIRGSESEQRRWLAPEVLESFLHS